MGFDFANVIILIVHAKKKDYAKTSLSLKNEEKNSHYAPLGQTAEKPARIRESGVLRHYAFHFFHAFATPQQGPPAGLGRKSD